jgi:hypothetical protein
MADPSIFFFAFCVVITILANAAEILKRLRLVGMEYDKLMAWWIRRQADHSRRKNPAPRPKRRKSKK